MQHVSTCDSHHQADLRTVLTFYRFYFVLLESHMPYTVKYFEVTYLRIILYVTAKS